MSRRANTIALAVGLVILAVGPLALTLARAPDYRSSATVSLNPTNPSAAYLPRPRNALADSFDVRDLQRDVAKTVVWFDSPDDLAEYVTVDQVRPGTFTVTAQGPSPGEARELAEVATAAALAAAEASARFTQPHQLQLVRTALRQEGLSEAERAGLMLRRQQLRASISERQAVFLDRPGPPTLQKERLGDRVLGPLPGSRPLRPDPVWAAVAGIALALAVALWVLVLSSSRAGGAQTRI